MERGLVCGRMHSIHWFVRAALESLQLRAVHERPANSALTTVATMETANSTGLRWVESGVLSCPACRCIYPIHRGVPILLRYPTTLAHVAYDGLPASLRRELREEGFDFSGDRGAIGGATRRSKFLNGVGELRIWCDTLDGLNSGSPAGFSGRVRFEERRSDWPALLRDWVWTWHSHQRGGRGSGS